MVWAFAAVLAGRAWAAPIVVGPPDDPRVRAIAGAPPERVETFAARFHLVSVVDRAPDDDCGGSVTLDAWRDGIDTGRRLTSTLKTEGALSAFSAADLEAACLDQPPATGDLVALQLALADVHLQLAMREPDPDARAVHQRESDAALSRAAAFGIDQAAPAGFDDALLMDFDARRAAMADSGAERPRLVIAGRNVGVRVNGRPVALNTPIEGVPGANLVQVLEGGQVRAAARVTLEPGTPTLVWAATGGPPKDAASLGSALAALDAAGGVAPADPDTALLTAAALLVGREGAPVRYAATRRDAAAVYAVQQGRLQAIAVSTDRLRPAVTAWRMAFGAGAEARWALGAAPAGSAGLGLTAAWAVRPQVVLGLAARPTATREPLGVDAGGGGLFRARVPVALEARYERADAPWTPVLGVSGGAAVTGGPVLPFGAATVGAARGIGAAGGFRAEARVAVDPQGVSFGVSVSTELRR